MTSQKRNFWNYGICQDILKQQCPRGLLTKNEHFGANCLWYVSRLNSENSIHSLLIFFGVDPKKNLEGFVWSFLSITGLRSQEQFAQKCSFLANRPLGALVLSEYPDKSHNFRNFIFMTSHFGLYSMHVWKLKGSNFERVSLNFQWSTHNIYIFL